MNTDPNTDNGWPIDGLERLLLEQRDLYRRLLGLAGHQRALIASDREEELLAVLGERQTIIDRLGVLAERFRPIQQKWPQVRARLSAEQSSRIDELLTEINGMLAELVEHDKQDAVALADRKAATASAVQGVKRVKQARAAYAAAQSSGGSGVDWSSS